MKFLPQILFILFLTGCATTQPSSVRPARCGRTPVMVSDLERFGFQPVTKKAVVVRLFRGSCPYCKEDLARLGELFAKNEWNLRDVQIFLIAYRKDGVENRKSFDRFVREEFAVYKIPMEATQIVYLDQPYQELVQSRNTSKHLIFEGWRAVPFGMIFGSDGRLAYRGHFTETPLAQTSQYKLVTSLQKEACPSLVPLP